MAHEALTPSASLWIKVVMADGLPASGPADRPPNSGMATKKRLLSANLANYPGFRVALRPFGSTITLSGPAVSLTSALT